MCRHPHRLMLLGAVKQGFLGEVCVELSCDVALEAADRFGFGLAFGASALEVVAGGGVMGQTRDHDPPQSAVGLTISRAAESMSLLFAAGSIEGRGAAESGEGTLVAYPARVLAGGDEKRARGVGADADPFDHLWGGLGDEWREDRVEGGDFIVEFEHPSGERLERKAIRAANIGSSGGAEPSRGANEFRD